MQGQHVNFLQQMPAIMYEAGLSSLQVLPAQNESRTRANKGGSVTFRVRI